MIRPLLRSAALTASAATLALAVSAVPSQAAVTDGHQVTDFSRCMPDDGLGFTFCVEGTDSRIEVHQPNGRAVFVSSGSATMTYTFANGDVQVRTSTYRGVSNFSYWLDGLFYDPQMILSDGATTMTLGDGSVCTMEYTMLGIGIERRPVRDEFTFECAAAS
ncbi:hypothetical protein GCM10012320_22470 [Sinomonas cellulolyticus]|uniref:Uncharacterized protein n=1 Tax=Sinomonas cellulolyticus TaxID=2801916 RepID=A0ABS1K2B9_9MICC|nr:MULTISPECIES: hypothetical protein [Sinomonas]MBL0705755.1 hypothetical protein [Sinomonas cellulolyticus]GHG52276.1 hypothetical protein GCM10012320_22470 [Sinomonas sp. KCTC 49339]